MEAEEEWRVSGGVLADGRMPSLLGVEMDSGAAGEVCDGLRWLRLAGRALTVDGKRMKFAMVEQWLSGC